MFLYAVGGLNGNPLGTADTAALNTIERAQILGFDRQPIMARPQVLNGSGLPPGTWFYRVSSVTAADGESLASKEVLAIGGGTIRVCWSNVNGATYNVYRSPAADGRFGTTRLLVPELSAQANVNGLVCFDDNGQNTNGRFLTPAPGRLGASVQQGGSLTTGVYSYRVAAVKDGKETVAGYAATVLVDTVNAPGRCRRARCRSGAPCPSR